MPCRVANMAMILVRKQFVQADAHFAVSAALTMAALARARSDAPVRFKRIASWTISPRSLAASPPIPTRARQQIVVRSRPEARAKRTSGTVSRLSGARSVRISSSAARGSGADAAAIDAMPVDQVAFRFNVRVRQ